MDCVSTTNPVILFAIHQSIGQAELDYHLVPSSSIVQECISIAVRSFELVLHNHRNIHCTRSYQQQSVCPSVRLSMIV